MLRPERVPANSLGFTTQNCVSLFQQRVRLFRCRNFYHDMRMVVREREALDCAEDDVAVFELGLTGLQAFRGLECYGDRRPLPGQRVPGKPCPDRHRDDRDQPDHRRATRPAGRGVQQVRYRRQRRSSLDPLRLPRQDRSDRLRAGDRAVPGLVASDLRIPHSSPWFDCLARCTVMARLGHAIHGLLITARTNTDADLRRHDGVSASPRLRVS